MSDPDLEHEHDAAFAAGAFEPCHAFAADHADEPCVGCGWLAVDHEPDGLAVVIAVPTRAPRRLRRAS